MNAFLPVDGGAMGAAVRAHDWAATPLGPADQWPGALRNALGLMLNSPESMYLVWGDALTFFFNDAYRPILGPRLEGALGQPLPVLWSDAWEAVRGPMEEALAGRASRFVDVPITMARCGREEQTWWSYSYSPIYDGDVVRGVFCFTVETTQRVHAQQQLAAEAEQQRRILDELPGFVWTANREGLVHYVSPRWMAFSGQPREQFLGEGWSNFVHPDDLPALSEAWERAVKARMPYEAEFRMRGSREGYRWWLSRAHPVAGEADGDMAWVGICTEMDAIIDAREMLSRSRDALQDAVSERTRKLEAAEEALHQARKMEAIGQLTGGLAHDFNNMLAAVSGALELMEIRLRQNQPEHLPRYIRTAQDATRRAAALTHRLLAFSRRQTLAPRPTQVDELAAGMVELIQRTVGPQVHIVTHAQTASWPALVDPSQLENALLNLCINARDAMPDGGQVLIETLNVHMAGAAARAHDLPEGDYLLLRVTDNGVGMPANVLGKAFDPFFTTKPLGQGTGLGLSMIYGFARQSGGQVRIASEVGQGTVVSIHLPRAVEGAVPVAAAGTQAVPDLAAQADWPVLVVEDEEAVRQIVAETLRDLGCRVLEAADSLAGMAMLRGSPEVRLLITDVGLPGGMNGRQLADAARSLRPALPVLFITGYAENTLLKDGQLEPGMAVLTKPFSVHQLTSELRRLQQAWTVTLAAGPAA
ncbi:ATP-binding protein [uncultured Pseudacidovorax sp.]|uniref:ATP-binding protein n=1 Tax=uncultured Pseudacidovorax sp. TaxID=679313 RepID=UPI0025F202BE|nr:ATP-binding protein [uncultured Pseudacidovorax sp.]